VINGPKRDEKSTSYGGRARKYVGFESGGPRKKKEEKKRERQDLDLCIRMEKRTNGRSTRPAKKCSYEGGPLW